MESQLVVKTTRVGLIMNALSLLKEASTKEEFALGMLRGFAINFLPKKRHKFAQYLFKVFELTPPIDLLKTPLNFHYSKT